MCGIVGFKGKGSFEDGEKMVQEIRYRGPNNQSVILKEDVCLGHARLSIIDLSESANQPMRTPDKSVYLVFNGEIYNFLELREMLEKTGKYVFSTQSDTEVLLTLYLEFGKRMLGMIHGMFSFSIYDFNNGELLLARDRMGQKPMYYTTCIDGTFVFGSELKTVTKHPSVSKEVSTEALNQYLTFDYVPTPNTIIKNIYKLEPASYLIFKKGVITENEKYWEHNFTINRQISFNNAITTFDELLSEAVRSRLVSDVPLGVFLSGGLDSSTIAYYAQRNSEKKINSFSLGFSEKSYDELNFANQVADHLGTDHHTEILTSKMTVDLIDEIYPLVDEPFADASLIPTYYLSKYTSQKVTVALGGDGSDELLFGYPTFQADMTKWVLSSMPKTIINLLTFLSKGITTSDANISLDFKIRQYLRGFQSTKNHVHQLWLGSFIPDEKMKLFKSEIRSSIVDTSGLKVIDPYFDKLDYADSKSKLANFYYHMYLLDDILYKVDRASMYNSLEVRSPFLDTSVVEFLNSLPYGFKQRGVTGKYLLKKLMENKLPQNIIYRSKKGFGIPLSQWIKHDLKETIEDTILKENEYFDTKSIKKILHQHQLGKTNNRKIIWNLFMFNNWLDST